MTRFLQDIRREPAALEDCLQRLVVHSRLALEEAVGLLRGAEMIHVVGIGSSWNAGIAVTSAFQHAGLSASLFDASELRHFGPFPKHAVAVMLSRSGRSVEIVRLLEQLRASQSTIVAVTNTMDSPLACNADVTVFLDAGFDHLVSVVMYSGLLLGGCLLATLTKADFPGELAARLSAALKQTEHQLDRWFEQVKTSDWVCSEAPTYFLGRGPSLASAQQARLLWEEAAKAPASALTTGGFRHGSQEAVWPGTRLALWIDPLRQREEDLQLAADLRTAGANVLLIGQRLPENAGDLVIDLPPIPAGWQPLVDIIPAQLAAECFARFRGQDCAQFRHCTYIVEQEGGLASGEETQRT